MAQKAEDLASFCGGSGKRDLELRIRSDSACSCDGGEYGVNTTISVPIKRNFPRRASRHPTCGSVLFHEQEKIGKVFLDLGGLARISGTWRSPCREIGSDNTHQDAGEIAYLRE